MMIRFTKEKTKFRLVSYLSRALLFIVVFCCATDIYGQCTNTSSFGSAVAPTAGTTTISTCSYQTEYSTISSVVAGTVYECAINAGGYVTIRSGTSNGPVVAHGPSPLQWSSGVSGTHYAHWNTNGLCGTATNCVTTSITFISAAAPCSAPLPQFEPFSSGILPPDWTSFFTTGDGWRFTGTPGYQAASNGRPAGSYAWIDFSGTDANTVLETPEWCTGGAPQAELSYDFYADLGANIISPFNILFIEAYDGVSWNIVQTNQENTTGWVNKTVIINSYVNGVGEDVIKVRFRGESGGASSDFYQDILLDNVNISEYNPCVTPNLSYTLNGTSPICQGSTTSITLSGSQVGVSYQILRNGTALNAPLAGTGGILNFGTYSTAGTYSILVFGGSLFCNGPFTLSSTFSLSVSTPPTAPTSITGNANISCGDQTILTISGGSNGSGATYQWYAGGCGVGPIIGTGPSIAPSPTTTTTYYVRRRGSLPCNVLTACAQVTVNVSTPNPPTVSDEFICPNTSATFTASGAPNGGSYNWFTDAAGTNQVGTGSTYTTPNLSATTTYYVQSTAAQPTQTYDQTIEISNPSLSASNLYNFLSTPQGAIGTATLTLTAVGDLDGTGTNLEQWSIDDEFGQNIGVIGGTGVAGDQCTNTLTNTITLSAADINAWAANGSIEFTALDLTGFINNTLCGDEFLRLQLVYEYSSGAASCVSSLVGVDAVVLPNPNLNYIILGGGSICSGTSTNISISGSQVGVSYQLLRNGVGTNPPLAGTGTSLSFGSQSTAGTYTVKLFPGSGFCSGTFFLNGSTTISIDQPPTAPTAITGTNTITCGNSTTLTVSGGSDGDGAEFEWFSGLCGNGVSIGSNSTLLVSPSVTTTYYARRKGTSACTSTTSCVSYQVTVNPTAAPSTTNDLICINNSGTVTASGAGIGQSYTWYDDAAGTNQVGTGSSFTSPILVAPSVTYYAQITNSGLYSQTTTVQNFDPVSNILVFNQTPNGPTTSATLTIYHRGDIDLTSEIFEVFNESNSLIGQTLNGLQCNTSYTTTTFTISQTDINNFAKDGLIAIELIRDASVSTTLCPNNDLFATLSYSYNSCPSALTPATITVNKPPTDPTGIIGNTNLSCGDQTVLTIDGGLNGSGATYQWYEGACGVGPVIGTGPSIAPSPATTTSYHVRRVGIAPCNVLTNCASVTVTVSQPNPPTVSDQSVCPGETATFNATGSSGTYHWYQDAAGSNWLATGDSYTTNPLLSSTTYYVQATGPESTLATTSAGGNGCTGGNMFNLSTNSKAITISSFDITPNLTGAQTVNVYYKTGTYVGSELNQGAWTLLGAYPINGTIGTQLNLPVEPLDLAPNTTYGFYINYNAQYTNGDNLYSDANISIQTGAGLCANFASLVASRTFNGAVNYYLCASSIIPVDAFVEPEPTLTYTINGGGTICTGSSSVISISGSQTNVAYQLLLNGTATNSAINGTGGSISFGPQTQGGTYTVKVFGGTGFCDGPFTLQGSTTITLQDPPDPPTTITGNNSINCGASTTLTVSGGDPGLNSTFEWYATACGSGPILSVGSTLTVSPSSTTNYFARRSSTSPCNTQTSCVSYTVSVAAPSAPSTSGDNVCSGSTATVTASGATTGQSYTWYDDAAGSNLIGTGASYTAGPLTSNTTYYAGLSNASVGTVEPLPGESTFSGNTRGYYFIAPVDFIMTGVFVPEIVGAVGQNVAIVRFNSTPTTFSTVSNDFSTLFLAQNDPTVGYIPVSISISAGDIIGVLGGRSTNNNASYSTFSSINIDGNIVTTSRLGMQFNLSTTAPQDLWTETFNFKSRVNFTYEASNCNSALTAAVVTVAQPPTEPTIINGSSTINCGDQTTLTASGGTDGSGATMEWYAGSCGSSPIIGFGNSITVSPNVTTTYYARRKGQLPCNVVTNCESFTVAVNLPPPPNTNDTSVCAGESATLSASGALACQSYTWYDDVAGANVVGSGPTFTTPAITAPTTYYVQIVDNGNYAVTATSQAPTPLGNTFDFTNLPSCPANGIANLTVYHRGDIDLASEFYELSDENGNVLGNTNTGPQCSATHTVTVFPLTSAQINAWAANGTISFTLTSSPDVNTTLCGDDDIYCVLSFEYGNGVCNSALASVDITLNPKPGAVTVSGSGTYCATTTINASGGVGGTIYFQGTNSGGTSTNTASASETITTDGTYYFRSYNGTCWSDEGSASVVINTPAVVDVSITSSPNPIFCDVAPSPVTYTAAPVNGGINAIYDWYLNGILAQSGTSNTFSIAVPQDMDDVYVVLNSTLSCTEDNPKTSNSLMTVVGTTPLNDECATADLLPEGINYMGTTACATASGQAACVGFFGAGSADDDVWYSFVASSTVMDLSAIPFGDFDPVLTVYSGTCAALNEITCIDIGNEGMKEYYSLSNLTIGNTYYVRVYSYFSGAQFQGTFNLFLEPGCSNLQNFTVSNNGPICEGSDLLLTSSAVIDPIEKTYVGPTVAISDFTGSGGNAQAGFGKMDLKVDHVGGLANSLDKLILNIDHTFVGDLGIYIVAPDGSSALVIDQQGGSGDNFTGTILSASGATSITTVTAADAPFTNTYQPENPLNALTGPADGVWTLYITDNAAGDVGTIIDYTLVFNNNASVSWSGPNAYSSSLQNPTITNAAATASGTYTLSANYPNGCQNDFTTDALVKEIPDPILIGADSVCLDDPDAPVTIFNPTAYDLIVTYTINGVSNTITIGANATDTLFQSTTTLGTFTYTLVSASYVAAPGCVTPLNASIDVVVIECCAEPSNAGTIAANQTICPGADPSIITNQTSASGQTGTLVYQWQASTDGTNWSDIIGANGPDYDPPALSASTFYRRLASVDCSAGFTNAVISNVVTIDVSDTQNPSVTCPADLILNTDANTCTNTIAMSPLSFSDNCTATLSWTVSGATSASGTGQIGTISFNLGTSTIDYVVTDQSGNTTTCQQDITVNDNESPVASCQNITIALDANGQASINAAAVDNGSTDNCSIANLTISKSTFNCNDLGANSITLTVTDGAGNTDVCTAIVTVEDNTSPVASCQDITIYLDASGQASITPAQINNGSTDACGSLTYTVNQNTFDCSDLGSNTVTLTVTDASNNSTTCTSTVTVLDTLDPVISCPSDIIVNNDQNQCSAVVTYTLPSFSDNCNGATVNLISGLGSGAAFPVGVNTEVYEVTDVDGNTAQCSFTVTVIDNQTPDIANCPLGIQVDNDPGQCSAIVTFAAPTVSDNCPGATITQTSGPSSGSAFPVGLTTVIFTATDAAGNISTCVVPVVVDDVEAPIIDCPGDTVLYSGSLSCDVAYTYPVTVIDNCSNTTLTQVAGIPSGGSFPLGVSAVTWQAEDTSGNLVQCTFFVTVIDTIKPSFINCPGDIVVEVGTNSCDAVVTWQSLSVTDNCPGVNISQIQGLSSGSTFPLGTTQNIFVVTDSSGNTDTCSFNVTIQDTVAPVIICPGDITLNDVCGPQSVNYNLPTSSDLCGSVQLTLISGPAVGDTFQIGTTTVVYQATDTAGNTATCSFDVTLNLKPSSPQPGPISGADSVCVGSSVTYSIATVPYAVSYAWSVNGGGTIQAYPTPTSIVVNWPVTGTGTVTVVPFNGCEDGPARTLSVQIYDVPTTANAGPDQLVCSPLASTTLAANTPSVGVGTWSVVSGSATFANVNDPNTQVSNLSPGTNVLRWTISNGVCPASSSDVNIGLDNVPPNIVCQSLTLYLPNNGIISINPAAVDNGTTDNCGVASLSLSRNTFDCNDVGNLTNIKLYATDSLGNIDSCTAQITVLDTFPPVAVCQNITVQLGSSGSYGLAPSLVDGGSSDNCAIDQMSVSPNSFDCDDVGVNIVTLTVVDVYGNSSSCQATITVQDTSTPDAICSNINLFLDANGQAVLNPASLVTNSSDPCGIASVSASKVNFDCSDVGPNVVIVTVVDSNGNQSQCSSVVTVYDNIAPNAVCKDISVQLDSNGQVFITGLDIDNGSNDSCGITQYVASPAFFDCDDIGPNTVTLTVTDANGNTASCSSIVTVVDNSTPTVVCVNDTVYLDSTGVASISPTVLDGGTSDACGTPTLSMSPNVTVLDSSDIGVNHFTLYATDGAGNIDSCDAIITVVDTFAPKAVCVASVDLFLDSSGQATISADQIDGGSYDFGGPVGLSVSPSSFDCSDVDTNIVTLTVTDNTANTSTCTAFVVVKDEMAPAAICQSVTIQLDANGQASLSATQLDNNSFDNCSILNYTLSQYYFDCSDLGQNNIDMTVKDVNNNASFCTAVVTVEDLIAPQVSCPSDLNVETNIGCTYSGVVGNPTIIENCTIDSIYNDAPSNYAIDTNQITWTVIDESGNIGTCVQKIVVKDTTSPQMTCPADYYVQPNFGCSYLGSIGYPSNISDNCSIASLINDAPFMYASGTNVITWTLTDNSGNTQVCSQIVEVQDFVPPTISCPPSAVVYVNSGCSYVGSIGTPTTADNCGNVTTTNDAPSAFSVGTTTVTWTATDDVGNTSICYQQVLVIDTTAPVSSCLADQSIYLNNNCEAFMPDYASQITATDNCGPVSMIQVPAAGTTIAGAGTLAVVVIISDQYGNKTSCNFDLNKIDTIAPSITCLGNQSLYLDANCSVVLPNYAKFVAHSDNCPVIVYQSPAAGTSIQSAGSTTITLTAEDASGNTTSCTFILQTIDVTPPVINCNADTTVDVVCLPATINLIPPSAIDACGGSVSISNSLQNNFTFKRGTTSVVWTATDAAGNSSSCIQNITVRSPEILVMGNSANIQNDANRTSSSNYTYFGKTDICTGSISRIFEIANVGNVDLNLLSNPLVYISGAASNEFTVVQQPSSNVLSPGQVVNFEIVFSPSIKGNRQARVWILNDDCDESNFNFAIRGIGTKCITQSMSEDEEVKGIDKTEVPDILTNEVQDSELSLKMMLYPNPNSGQFTIYFDQPLPENASLILFNQMGQQIYEFNEPTQHNTYAMNALSSGVYYVRLKAGAYVLSRKVIIKK